MMSNVPDVRDHLAHVLALLRKAPSGLMLDFDGTVSAIAPAPALAFVDPGCREALAAIVERLSIIAVISGRPAGQLRDLLGIPGISYLGNHGMERWQNGRTEIVPEAASYRQAIATALVEARAHIGLPGVFFEDKGIVLAMHYRSHSKPSLARQTMLPIARAIAAANALQVAEGKCVIELRPPVAIDKGTALAGIVDEQQLKAVLYLGDDKTDLAAFRRLRRLRKTHRCDGIGIVVLAPDTPGALLRAADYSADGVPAVASTLQWLLTQLIGDGR